MEFVDLQGRTWSVRLDFATVAALRDSGGVDFGDLETLPKAWAGLLADDGKALDVVWRVVHRGDVAGKEFKDFAQAMDGETLYAALIALGESIVNFTPPPRRGTAKAAIATVTDGYKAAIAAAEAALTKVGKDVQTRGLEALGIAPQSAPGYSATLTTGGRYGKRTTRSKQNARNSGGR